MTREPADLAALQARLDDLAPLREDGETRYARAAGDYLAALAADAIAALRAATHRPDVRGLRDGPWQQRSDAATPGPWERLDTGSEGCSIVSTVARPAHRVARLTSGPLDVCQANAELIVMAVNYVRSLLALAANPAPEPVRDERFERERIEQDARLQDAYDALRAAVLWLHGEYRDTPRSEFNAEAWYRKARSGNVGLRDYLAAAEGGSEPASHQYHSHDDDPKEPSRE